MQKGEIYTDDALLINLAAYETYFNYYLYLH